MAPCFRIVSLLVSTMTNRYDLAIPRIIHQTWKTEDVPEQYDWLIDTWKTNHPDWEYMLWTDEDNRKLIETHYPWFLSVFDAYPHGIQRADAVRPFILHRFGGLYVDLDFESLHPIDDALRGCQLVLGYEHPSQCRKSYGKERVVCNALMASVPGHPLWERLWKAMQRRFEAALGFPGERDVLRTTGPWILNYVVEHYPHDDLTVYDWRTFYPLTAEDATHPPKVYPAESYAVHHWFNSWIKKQ